MSHRKRKLEDFDPNKSDSADSDFDIRAQTQSTPRSRKNKLSKPFKNRSRPAPKRRRETYADSEDDIVDDDEEIDESERSFQEDSASEEEAEVNPRTGRKQRRATKKEVKYEEPSEDDIEEPSDSDEPQISPKKIQRGQRSQRTQRVESVQPKQTLIVKLHVPSLYRTHPIVHPTTEEMHNTRTTRSRTGSKTTATRPTPERLLGQRRSSRLSHNDEEPLIALTDSGRHAQVTRPGTATPEPPSSRPTRSNKGLKQLPSTVFEDSQEVSREDLGAGPEDIISQLQQHASQLGALTEAGASDRGSPITYETQADTDVDAPGEDIQMDEAAAEEAENADDDDDDDEGPIKRRGSRTLRSRTKPSSPEKPLRRSLRSRKSGGEQSSDFEPEAEGKSGDENISSDDELANPKQRTQRSDNDSSSGTGGRRSRRLASKRARDSQHSDEELDPDEIADEAAELDEDRRRNKRPRRSRRDEGLSFEPNLRTRSKRPDYRVFRPELLMQDQEEDVAVPSASQQRRKAAGPYKSLFSTLGPFGGAGGPAPVFGGPEGTGAAGGADSDSSDDDLQQKLPRGVGGTVGMTPTSAAAHNFFPQTHNADPTQTSGAPANLGKVKDKKALADADPLGVDPNVNFDGVGGLSDHIDRLQEMVALPLLYPEVFQRFHVTPPRGVLFHGPPGTGKTLLARALASSVSSHGKKVTFYMRKGADALSKWVGEAERQLRLLFEEARKNQPSIIFFDEIDGLAPVRSSKQEQIHASIVATLLALMDGMDGRGQVIVIGATNRPDSVDPALRRPGRFDREFYFPLPNQQGRRAIIDIHTKGWDPPLKPEFKDKLAELTKGYGGADLRALCTEAALNAVQGTYPQIYSNPKKLLIDPEKIKVLAKDFMISIKKMVPSSERSASSGAAPLKKSIEPLLRDALNDITRVLENILPHGKKLTALEEAMFDDREDERGFEKENMQREFESARIFRPRLLIRGTPGAGQQYISGALLAKFEGLHVQNFGLPTLLNDSTRAPEAAVVQLFEEVKRHKPAVIYIPNVDIWYHTLSEQTIRTFTGLLRTLPPTDPVLLLGVMESPPPEGEDEERRERLMIRDLFGYSLKNAFTLRDPSNAARSEYFATLVAYIKQSPADFPNPDNRKRRVLPTLPEAPAIEPEKREPTKEELKLQKKQDRHTLNMLKIKIQPVMDQIKLKYKKFRQAIIDEREISYIFDEQDPSVVTTDLGHEEMQQIDPNRPYKLSTDDKGEKGILETATNKFYYNLDIVIIEQRLSNGYYKRPKDFLADIRRLAKDAKTSGDPERTLKANEMLANVEVDMTTIEMFEPALVKECEAVYDREQARASAEKEKEEQARREGQDVPIIHPNVPPAHPSTTTTETTGPVHLGEAVPGVRGLPPFTPQRLPRPSPLSNGYSVSNGSHHPQSNGSTIPSRFQEDSEMTDSQNNSLLQNPQERAGWQQQTYTPSNQDTQHTGFSQTGGHTKMPIGSHVGQFYNSASTTTSGQKTSDRSNRSSGPYTQNSNGNGPAEFHPAFLPPVEGGSQLPDTQPEQLNFQSSQSQPSQSSQDMGPPAVPTSHQQRHAAGISALLNPENEAESKASATSQPQPKLIAPDEPQYTHLCGYIVDKSTGLSVEQLEQVMAAMMEAIWQTKTDWNRNHAMNAVRMAFNETIKDIEEIQGVNKPSQKALESIRQREREERRLMEEMGPGPQTQFEMGGQTQFAGTQYADAW